MAFKEKIRGGARKGAGRKIGPAAKLKQWVMQGRTTEATFAFNLFCSVMHDDLQPTDMRMAAAKEVLDRVIGKPSQALLIADWREAARKDGYDPERLFSRLVEAGRTALDGASEGGSVSSAETIDNYELDAPDRPAD